VCTTIRSADLVGHVAARVNGDSAPARHSPPLWWQSQHTHLGESCKPRHVAALTWRVAVASGEATARLALKRDEWLDGH
jgi:hypothetical protein